jgi:predicted ATPase/DNA-binding NarL/FixJ family response regulator
MLTAPTPARPAPWSASLPSRSSDAVGNLPSEVNTFIGREHERVRLCALQAETRLLTLVGPGGVGKTRLALRLQEDLRDAFPDGIWLVDLSPIGDPALVPQALGDVLGVRQPQGQSWLDELIRVLRPRRLLVVLDNCEHVVAACAELAEGLLRQCPDLRMVATSLQPLGAAGETTWRVRPLSVPTAGVSAVEELGASEAVRLFVARVRTRLPNFTLGGHNAPLVAEICRRLDGLPLALELVAARVEGLGLAEIAARLTDRFALAVGANRTAPARQRTLQAALEWSCGLLDDDERALLRRVGVFVGGWTLEAAEAVCAGHGLAAASVVDVLGRLVSKSLVVAEHDGLDVRYRLLETVRAYALDQLATADEKEATRGAHAGYVQQVAERMEFLSLDSAQAVLLRAEEGNLRAALEWTVEYGHADLGLRLASRACPMWLYSGHLAEGRSWLGRLLALPSPPEAYAARADALSADAQLLLTMGSFASAHSRGQAALQAQRAHGDERGVGLALTVLGNMALQRGDLAEARALHSEAAERLRRLGSPAVNLRQLALVACELGDAPIAHQLIDELEAIGQTRRDAFALSSALYEKGLLAAASGETSAASDLLEQALAGVRSNGYQTGIVYTLTALGHVRLTQGRREAALAAFAEVIRLVQTSGERIRLIRALEGVARGLAQTDAGDAVRLAGAADAQRQALGAVPWPSERRYRDGWLVQTRRSLGPSAFQRAWDDGQASTVAQAISLAEALLVAPAAASVPSALTAREQEVAILLAQGLTNKQIAAELVLSPATVRSHVEHILDKLNLHSRAQIAVWASQQGLLLAPVPG